VSDSHEKYTSGQHCVAFLDFLGFRDTVRRMREDSVLFEGMLKALRSVAFHAEQQAKASAEHAQRRERSGAADPSSPGDDLLGQHRDIGP
jgi:hypothetical protein